MAVNFSETEYKNFGKCVCLENGNIKLIATVDIGPRIIYFGLKDGENVLFEDTDRNFFEDIDGYGRWYTYGGHRVWCAPELVPETYYPDNANVAYDYTDGKLTLKPAVTPFGKQLELVIEMGEGNEIKLESRITNVSDKDAEFAPWSITALAPNGVEIIPFCKDDNGYLPNRVISLWSYTDIADKRFTLKDNYAVLRQDPNAEKAFKIGINSTEGYASYIVNNSVFSKKFGKYEPLNYPDFSCNFETYTNKYFLECELVGEKRFYKPNETAVISECWSVEKLGIPVLPEVLSD